MPMTKLRERTWVTNSRRATSSDRLRRPSAAALIRPPRRARRLHDVAVQLGQRRSPPAEPVHRTGGHAPRPAPLVVGARSSRSRVPDRRESTTSTPASVSAHPGGGPSTSMTTRRVAVAQLLDRADGDHPPGRDDADPVAEPLDQLQLVAGEDHRDAGVGLVAQHARSSPRRRSGRARRTARRAPAPRGRARAPRPAGRAAGCPARASAPRRPAARSTPEPLGPVVRGRRCGLAGGQPVQPGQVAAAARRPSSSGRGRAPPACSRCAGARRRRPASPSPAHLTGVGRQHAERRSASSWSCRRRCCRRTRTPRPARTANVTSSSACPRPNRLVIPRMSSMGDPRAAARATPAGNAESVDQKLVPDVEWPPTP